MEAFFHFKEQGRRIEKAILPSLQNSGLGRTTRNKECFFRSLKFERLDSCRFVTRHSAETEVLDYHLL
jgi:hypothetical protein